MNWKKLNRGALALGLLVSMCASTLAADSDWPQWRGINRDGISPETGLLKEWPKQGPPLAWKATGIGAGYSGVAVVKDRIYTMGDASDASYIHALNEADGKPIWTAKIGKTGGGDGYPGPRCTPTVAGNLILALGQFGDLVCVEAATGKEKWRKDLVGDFDGKMMSGWGYSESPLVDGNKVIVTPGGSQGAIIALDRETGQELWRTKEFTDPAAYSSVVIAEIAGKRQYVQLTGQSVVGVAPDDGKVLWRAARKGSTAVITTPVVHDDCVYVTSAYGVGCNMFKVTASSGQFKAEQVYANKVMANHHGGVIRLGEHVYGFSDGKGWVCQELKTGKSVWEEKGQLGKGAITYADGRFYLRSEAGKGTVVLLEASPKGYKEFGRFDQPDRSSRNSWPHPVIAHGKLYLRDQGTLLCYKLKP
jgi:outer membrane protein assembly factor BamB